MFHVVHLCFRTKSTVWLRNTLSTSLWWRRSRSWKRRTAGWRPTTDRLIFSTFVTVAPWVEPLRQCLLADCVPFLSRVMFRLQMVMGCALNLPIAAKISESQPGARKPCCCPRSCLTESCFLLFVTASLRSDYCGCSSCCRGRLQRRRCEWTCVFCSWRMNRWCD